MGRFERVEWEQINAQHAPVEGFLVGDSGRWGCLPVRVGQQLGDALVDDGVGNDPVRIALAICVRGLGVERLDGDVAGNVRRCLSPSVDLPCPLVALRPATFRRSVSCWPLNSKGADVNSSDANWNMWPCSSLSMTAAASRKTSRHSTSQQSARSHESWRSSRLRPLSGKAGTYPSASKPAAIATAWACRSRPFEVGDAGCLVWMCCRVSLRRRRRCRHPL